MIVLPGFYFLIALQIHFRNFPSIIYLFPTLYRCTACVAEVDQGHDSVCFAELNKDPHKLEEICSGFDLQPRGSSGEHSAAVGGKWDISNKQRIGFSEVQLVQKMIDGVAKLIAIEQKLAAESGNAADK